MSNPITMDDLKDLKEWVDAGYHTNAKVLTALMEIIEDLKADNAALRAELDKALEVIGPFNKEAEMYWDAAPDGEHLLIAHKSDLDVDETGDWVSRDDLAQTQFTIGHLRALAAFTERHKSQGESDD